MNLNLGDRLWLVDSGNRNSDPVKESEVTVTKLGRKWFMVNNNHSTWHAQYSVETGYIKTSHSPRERCYQSKAIYDMKVLTNDHWNQLTRFFSGRYSKPEHLTLGNMIQILELLGETK